MSLGCAFVSAMVWGCWGCEDIGSTFSQEIQRTDLAIIATVVDAGNKPSKPPDPAADADDSFRTVRLRVARFVKDSMQLQRGDEVSVTTNQTLKPDARYLLMGFGKKQIMWTAPLEVSEHAERYILDGLWAPKEGPARVAFFLPYLDDTEAIVAEDAYKEFAKAPYKEVKEIREKLDREHLLKRLHDDTLSSRLRRLYLTLLGACGRPDDATALLPFLDRREKVYVDSIDTTIACYLTLRGAAGMDLIESRYFINKETDKRHTQAAINALRFHMTEEQAIPRARVLDAAHQLLDRPDMADLIIDDLILWEDWTVSDKLVKLFKSADKETSFVRKPVIHYLKACPLPESGPSIEELRRIDPEAVELAELTAAGRGPAKKPAAVPGVDAPESMPEDSQVAKRPPPVQVNTLVRKSFHAGRLFAFALLFAAAGVALISVWFLVRRPMAK